MNSLPTKTASRHRGSALVTVLMFALVLLLLSGSIVTWSLSERRVNTRNAAWLEARNAAEAVAEYGCYQVAQAFNTRMNPTFSAGGTNPVTFPSALATSFFTGSNVNVSDISLSVGAVTDVPKSGYDYVNPANAGNTNDPMVGRFVRRRDVTVVAKASVTPPSGGAPITAYIEEKVSVRGAPLLAYAIFYSGNDLEFNETPQMDIYGAVHVNGNLFVGPAGSNPQPLSFHGQVTVSGNVFHAWRGTTTTGQEGGAGMSSTTPVNFSTDGVGATAATLFNMRTSGGIWNDSTMGADASVNGVNALTNLLDPAKDKNANTRNTNFAQYAAQTWKGSLLTSAMGIQSYNPMGFSEVVAHDSTTNTDIQATNPVADDNGVMGTGASGTYGKGYGPHALIEPPQDVSASDTYAAAKQSIEQTKFSRKAGLYVRLTVAKSTTAGQPDVVTAEMFGDPNSAPAGTAASNIGPNGGLRLSGTVPASVIKWVPYSKDSSNNVKSGIYDQRQGAGVNLAQIDMVGLKTALQDMAAGGAGNATVDITDQAGNRWGNGTAKTGYDPNISGSTGWNGGVYVDVQNTNSSNQTAVILANGQVASGATMIPNAASAPNGVDGLTVATNAPGYILGNFNADGNVAPSGTSNNSAMWADDYPGTSPAGSAETPVAFACDAITVLSPNYFGTASSGRQVPAANTSGSSGYNSYTKSAPNASSSVEIAAALITGTVTTSPDSTGTQMYSGGVHNLPRFLEWWNDKNTGAQLAVAIRGSMVSMYNSRVASARWQQFYYSAPIRQWGYDQLFANGRYPPIVPQVISYRRVDFTYLKNATDYATELGKL